MRAAASLSTLICLLVVTLAWLSGGMGDARSGGLALHPTAITHADDARFAGAPVVDLRIRTVLKRPSCPGCPRERAAKTCIPASCPATDVLADMEVYAPIATECGRLRPAPCVMPPQVFAAPDPPPPKPH